MNILLIGNGFDLAHNLPTKYDDFLHFIQVLSQMIKKNIISEHISYSNLTECNNLNTEIKNKIYDDFTNNNDLLLSWKELIINNLWLNYFFENRQYIEDNWIDFEKEILLVISNLDEFIKKNPNDDLITFLSLNASYNGVIRNFKIFLDSYLKKEIFTYSSNTFQNDIFIKELEEDLDKLIFALERYINEYVNKMNTDEFLYFIPSLKIDKIISFNYTDTFNRIYNKEKKYNDDDFDFIHGKAIEHCYYKDTRLVLGINEYLPDNEKNSNVQFIRYKKFFQRIHKNTGYKYTEWTAPTDDPELTHNLYIFGHSLDSTDGDILRDLILDNRINTTIFYHDRAANAQQIINLVKIIGQDELIKRTEGYWKSIKFVEQSKFQKF